MNSYSPENEMTFFKKTYIYPFFVGGGWGTLTKQLGMVQPRLMSKGVSTTPNRFVRVVVNDLFFFFGSQIKKKKKHLGKSFLELRYF